MIVDHIRYEMVKESWVLYEKQNIFFYSISVFYYVVLKSHIRTHVYISEKLRNRNIVRTIWSAVSIIVCLWEIILELNDIIQ